MKTTPLVELGDFGQSPWLDNLHRGMIESGALARLVSEDGIQGVTTNPTIFEGAISAGHDYDDAFRDLASRGVGARDAYDEIVTGDVRRAADVLRPVYDATARRDGFVSLEVEPDLADDASATVRRAEELFAEVSRPNVLIKIPATEAGLEAIERTLAKGIPVNVTLIFSVKRYEAVAEAWLRGLEHLAEEEGELAHVASVASFFVSRVDTAVDRLLDDVVAREPASDRARIAKSLRGTVAIASARLAYASFRRIVAGPRWAPLAAKGATVQRPLWASTGTKDPTYPDVLYVDELVGPDTVDTMPPKTMDAYRDHGAPEDRLTGREAVARATLDDLAQVGIGIEPVCARLLEDGVAGFTRSYRTLLEAIGRRLEAPQEESSP
jgi:transaldolase